MAYTILRNAEDAEDAVQDALLSAYLHLRAFEGRSALTTWFGRIVLNAAFMIRRKRKPSQIDLHPESSNTEDIPWTERVAAREPDPEMFCAERETFELINALLGKMTPTLRQAFTMTYFDELSNKQAGDLLGVAKGTFKSRLFRAKRHLMCQTQRSQLAPIRRVAHSSPFPGRNDFPDFTPKLAEISSEGTSFL